MKNFTSSSARFIVITFFALVSFSLVAFAAKGPCVFKGFSENESEDFQYDKHGNRTGCIVTTIESSNGYRCAGLNEEECETFYDPEALKSITTTCTYTLMDNGEWFMVNAATEYKQGVTKC